jgi:hypothetical protein
MFWTAAIIAIVNAVLHAARTGELFDEQRWAERLGRLSTSMCLASIALAMMFRAVENAVPFVWIHWVVMLASLLGVLTNIWLLLYSKHTDRRRRLVLRQTADEIYQWLAEVEHFEPCENTDCLRVRHEMLIVAEELKRHI